MQRNENSLDLDISILFEDFLMWLFPNFTASKDFIKLYVLSLEYQLWSLMGLSFEMLGTKNDIC